MKKIPQDIIGNIALLKFKKTTPFLTRKLKSYLFLRKHPSVTTILEKTAKFSGKTRLQQTRYLAGEFTKEVKYTENNCTFYFNIDKTYFSPRLSNERRLISDEILKLYNKKKKLKILVMFSGISVFPIVIAKKLKQNKLKNFIIYSNELNKDANEYAKKNIQINKLQDYIKLIPGDAKDIPQTLEKLRKNFQNKKSSKALAFAKKGGRKVKDFSLGGDFENSPEKFDVIIMTRPNLKETFLKTALKLSKKNTKIFYHGFGTYEEVLEEIIRNTSSFDLKNKRSDSFVKEGGKNPKKVGREKSKPKSRIKNLKIRKAGDIGREIYRWNAEFIVK